MTTNPQGPSQLRQRLAGPFLLIALAGYKLHWRHLWFVGLWLTQLVLGIQRIQHLNELAG